MSPEYLFALVAILLPIAACSGWYYGRKDAVSSASADAQQNGMSPDYFRGLNYLLNDRPDKAIEVFIKVLEVEQDTVETHLALGNLFRRRGEVDRAIRVHQNLVARPSLAKEQRGLALLELGVDYMRAGLLDRAEKLFKELVQMHLYEREGLGNLVDIYQQEQDWDSALEYTRLLSRVTNEDLGQVRAHFFCEKAENFRAASNSPEAFRALDKALKEDKKCVRAQLLYADISYDIEDHRAAITRLKKIEGQDVDFLPEAIPRLVENFRKLEKMNELSAYLKRLSNLHSGITPVLVLAELTAEQIGLQEAKSHIVSELKMRPTIRGIDRLIEYSLVEAQGEAKDNLRLLKETTSKLVEDRRNYQCGVCGFTGRSLHWQCPGCKSWNTVKPIHGIEGE